MNQTVFKIVICLLVDTAAEWDGVFLLADDQEIGPSPIRGIRFWEAMCRLFGSVACVSSVKDSSTDSRTSLIVDVKFRLLSVLEF